MINIYLSKCSLKPISKALKTSTGKLVNAVDLHFPQQGEQRVNTYVENSSSENQVKDVYNHLAQEAKQRINKYLENRSTH